jgi:beta-phosphoglucomutase
MPCVIFDLDGTLIDSYGAHFKAWIEIAAELGHDLSEREFARSFGRKNEPIIEELHGFVGKPVPEKAGVQAIADRKESLYRGHVGGDAFPDMDGAVELVKALQGAGWRTAIGSSAPRINVDFATDRFRVLGIAFDAVACGCDVARGKPEPDVFLHAAELLKLPASECIVFEDAAPGIEAGHRAGMVTVGIASRGRTRAELSEAHHVIDALDEHCPASLAKLLVSAQRRPV